MAILDTLKSLFKEANKTAGNPSVNSRSRTSTRAAETPLQINTDIAKKIETPNLTTSKDVTVDSTKEQTLNTDKVKNALTEILQDTAKQKVTKSIINTAKNIGVAVAKAETSIPFFRKENHGKQELSSLLKFFKPELDDEQRQQEVENAFARGAANNILDGTVNSFFAPALIEFNAVVDGLGLQKPVEKTWETFKKYTDIENPNDYFAINALNTAKDLFAFWLTAKGIKEGSGKIKDSVMYKNVKTNITPDIVADFFSGRKPVPEIIDTYLKKDPQFAKEIFQNKTPRTIDVKVKREFVEHVQDIYTKMPEAGMTTKVKELIKRLKTEPNINKAYTDAVYTLNLDRSPLGNPTVKTKSIMKYPTVTGENRPVFLTGETVGAKQEVVDPKDVANLIPEYKNSKVILPTQRAIGSAQLQSAKLDKSWTRILSEAEARDLINPKDTEAIAKYFQSDNKTLPKELEEKLKEGKESFMRTIQGEDVIKGDLFEEIKKFKNTLTEAQTKRGLLNTGIADDDYLRTILIQPDGTAPTAKQIAALKKNSSTNIQEALFGLNTKSGSRTSIKNRYNQRRAFENIDALNVHLARVMDAAGLPPLKADNNFWRVMDKTVQHAKNITSQFDYSETLRKQGKQNNIDGIREVYDPELYKKIKDDLIANSKTVKIEAINQYKSLKEKLLEQISQEKTALDKIENKIEKQKNLAMRTLLKDFKKESLAIKERLEEKIDSEIKNIEEQMDVELEGNSDLVYDTLRLDMSKKTPELNLMEFIESNTFLESQMRDAFEDIISEAKTANKELQKTLIENFKEQSQFLKSEVISEYKQDLAEINRTADVILDELYQKKSKIWLTLKNEINKINNQKRADILKEVNRVRDTMAEYADQDYKPFIAPREAIAVENQLKGLVFSKPIREAMYNYFQQLKPSSFEDATIALKAFQASLDAFEIPNALLKAFNLDGLSSIMGPSMSPQEFLNKELLYIGRGLVTDRPNDIKIDLLKKFETDLDMADKSLFAQYANKTIEKGSNLPIIKSIGKGIANAAAFSNRVQFDFLVRNLKVKTMDGTIKKFEQQYPDLNREEVETLAATFTNDLFKGLNWQRMMAANPNFSKSTLRTLRKWFFGPDKNAAFVLRHTKMFGKYGSEYRRFFLRSILAGFAILQALNYVTTGHSTLDNKRGNLLAVELPFWRDKKGNPIALDPVGETLDLAKFIVSGPGKFISNKFNPVPGTVMKLLVQSPFAPQSFKEAAADVTPFPISFQTTLFAIIDELIPPEKNQVGDTSVPSAIAQSTLNAAGFPTQFRSGSSKSANFLDWANDKATFWQYLFGLIANDGKAPTPQEELEKLRQERLEKLEELRNR